MGSVNVLIFLFSARGLPAQGNSFKPCLAFSLLRYFRSSRGKEGRSVDICALPYRARSLFILLEHKMFSFPFFFSLLKIRPCFFLWLISMDSSYRISALICNASLWLFFLKVWSHRGVHYKSFFSVATCLLQTSPFGASWVSGCVTPCPTPRTGTWGCHVFFALCMDTGGCGTAVPGVSDLQSAASPSSGRVCPLCHRSEH